MVLWSQSEKPIVYCSHWTEGTLDTEASPIAKSSIKTEAAHPSVLLHHAPKVAAREPRNSGVWGLGLLCALG